MSGLRIARVFGIDLVLHWSLLVIVMLVALAMAQGEVPTLHPRWSQQAAWAVGLCVSVGLVVSIAAHELAHALVARMVGVPVPRITLFVFGGMAQMGGRPKRAAHEFAITAAGPLTSLVLGVALSVASGGVSNEPRAATAGAIASLSAAILGQVNVVLALFNCLPGLPLDGGRMLHSLIWRVTGSEARATAVASIAGQGVGALLMTVGVLMMLGVQVPPFGTGSGGLWLVLIGWFLTGLARSEGAAYPVERAAGSTAVLPIVRAVPLVAAETPLDEFADGVLLPTGEHALPIVDNGRVVGLACLHDVLKIEEVERPLVAVSAVMTPWESVRWLDAGASVGEAADMLAELGVEQVPVVDEDRVVGIVRRSDIEAWLTLHTPGKGNGGRPAS